MIINRRNFNKQYAHDKLDAAARELVWRLTGEGRWNSPPFTPLPF